MINKSKKHFAYGNMKRPLMSFAIANNLLTPNIRATDLGISPWTIWNNSKNHEDGPLVWNILRDVHVSSQKTHLKTNGEEWLRLK